MLSRNWMRSVNVLLKRRTKRKSWRMHLVGITERASSCLNRNIVLVLLSLWFHAIA